MRFASVSYTASEGSVIPILILKQGSSGLPVTVNISTMGITASASDFYIQPEVVTFQANQNEQLVNLVAISDTVVEGTETLTLNLTTNNMRIVIENSAVVTIEDVSGINNNPYNYRAKFLLLFSYSSFKHFLR